MEQNNKKTYDLRVEGNQIVLVGTSSDTLGQVLAFRAKISDDANATPPVRELAYEDIIVSGMEYVVAEKLSLLIGSHLEPNYPDNPYVVRHAVHVPAPKPRGGNPYSRELPVDPIELVNWAEQNDIVITGLPPIDQERMSKEVEGNCAFEIFQDGARLVVNGVSRDILGTTLDVYYQVQGDHLIVRSFHDIGTRKLGPEYLDVLAIAAAAHVAVELAKSEGRQSAYKLAVTENSELLPFGSVLRVVGVIAVEGLEAAELRPKLVGLIQDAADQLGFHVTKVINKAE